MIKNGVVMKELGSVVDGIYGGQIMNRIVASPEKGDLVCGSCNVLTTKCICSDGTIDTRAISVNVPLKVNAAGNPKLKERIAHGGDIIIKLSPPYDAAMVDQASDGCLIPSFCARIACSNCWMNATYVLAFLNSERCKTQLRNQAGGSVVQTISAGVLKKILIPAFAIHEQEKIAGDYVKTQKRMKLMREIMSLEAKRNDALIEEMMLHYE